MKLRRSKRVRASTCPYARLSTASPPPPPFIAGCDAGMVSRLGKLYDAMTMPAPPFLAFGAMGFFAPPLPRKAAQLKTICSSSAGYTFLAENPVLFLLAAEYLERAGVALTTATERCLLFGAWSLASMWLDDDYPHAWWARVSGLGARLGAVHVKLLELLDWRLAHGVHRASPPFDAWCEKRLAHLDAQCAWYLDDADV